MRYQGPKACRAVSRHTRPSYREMPACNLHSNFFFCPFDSVPKCPAASYAAAVVVVFPGGGGRCMQDDWRCREYPGIKLWTNTNQYGVLTCSSKGYRPEASRPLNGNVSRPSLTTGRFRLDRYSFSFSLSQLVCVCVCHGPVTLRRTDLVNDICDVPVGLTWLP